VAGAGINFLDTYRRSGVYPIDFPHVGGSEGAGVIEAVGEGVTELPVGERVAWAEAPGSYAELVIVAADLAIPVPAGVGDDVAAALPLQGMRPHDLCASTYPVAPGQSALVLAGAGGVGLLLTQLIARRG